MFYDITTHALTNQIVFQYKKTGEIYLNTKCVYIERDHCFYIGYLLFEVQYIQKLSY